MIARVFAGVTFLLLVFGTGAGAAERVLDLAIQHGALPDEQRLIRIQQGDEVTLRWTTDRPITIHLHGYDIERTVRPQTPSTMQFRARATGRFAITVHGHGKHGHGRDEEKTLGYLEVHPR